jgi:hypothetical protein
MLNSLTPQKTLIRLVGLLDQVPDKKFMEYCVRFDEFGYQRDIYPTDNVSKQMLQDYLYPDFRKIMFSDISDDKHVRYKLSKSKQFDLLVINRDDSKSIYNFTVSECELFLFRGYIGLFSLKIEIGSDQSIDHISNVLSKIRNFSARNTENIEWHSWITENYLAGISLRSSKDKIVEADEYSGSKFKLFTAYDLNVDLKDRPGLLYDLGTVSPINSGNGMTSFSPDPEYYDLLMQNRVAAFKNWEAISLFDGFCAVGTDFLLDNQGLLKKDWDITYFRLYLFRLFFKYNLYRYSTLIANAESDTTVQYRDQFEHFLNHYHISHISFNFLPNLIFEKIGNALDLKAEVEMFRERIRNLTTTIQEQKQAKTNKLLQAVTTLSFLGIIVDINDFLQLIYSSLHQLQKYTHLAMTSIYLILLPLVLLSGIGIYYYLEPSKVKKWFARK